MPERAAIGDCREHGNARLGGDRRTEAIGKNRIDAATKMRSVLFGSTRGKNRRLTGRF